MGIFPLFRLTPAERESIKVCRDRIHRKIIERCGCVSVIEIEEDIAFAGSKEAPKLLLSVFIQKSRADSCLGACVDDEVSWYESDFVNRESFEDAVANHIAQLIGAVIKTVTEKKRFSYIKINTFRMEGDGWSLIEETVVDFPFVRIFIWKDSTREQICTYQMESENKKEEQP